MADTTRAGGTDPEKQPLTNGYRRGCPISRPIVILVIIALLVFIVIVFMVLGIDQDTYIAEEFAQCPYYQNTSCNTVPGQGSKGEKWRATDCRMPSSLSCPDRFNSPPTIVISTDGFRHSYLHRGLTPNLQRLMDCGTSAEYMRPVFPSKTFPNHIAQVTGLYPESHGIIDNKMYDKSFKETFTLAIEAVLDGKWYNGEPIWNTAMKAGKRARTFYWPGSEANIQGMRPDACFTFEKFLPFEWRVDEVLKWLDLPEDERPDLINLYFVQPDASGHAYGPDSEEVNTNLTRVDNMIGMLMDGITERGLEHCVNIVLMSDHGMSHIICDDMVDVSEKVDPETHFVYTGTVGRISGDYNWGSDGYIHEYPHPTESADSIISKWECQNYSDTVDHYSRAYLKQNLPKHFHYAHNQRIEDVIVLTEGERLVTTKQTWESDCRPGEHGFDNTLEHMRAIFITYGPNIKQNHTIEAFDCIEVYNYLTDLLDVPPAPQNGTYGRLHDIMVSPPPYPAPDLPVEEYVNCPVPNRAQCEARRDALSECHCDDFHDLTALTEDEADLLLNLTASDIVKSLKENLPTAAPRLQAAGATCSLIQRDYISGYNDEVRMPLWSAYTLDIETIGLFNSTDDINCVRPDVRLSTEQATPCEDYVDEDQDVTWEYLYPPGYTKDRNTRSEAYLATNIVPMYTSFKRGIWRDSQTLIEAYVQKYGKVQVISGPIFDNNYDGLRDDKEQRKSLVASGPVPLPTHFFHTLTRCSTGEEINNCEELDTMTVVIPHNPHLGNCWDIARGGHLKYLQENVARVRDIELLTALGFHDNISNDYARIVLRTRLSVKLWAL